jgi:DNA-binding GntR family transcriptional regulator
MKSGVAMMEIEKFLRDDIVSGELPFGSRLRIDALATRYGVSHMPIREALRVLHGEGLVIIEPKCGARVRQIDPGFIEDLFDVRTALETMLARRAAERRTEEHLERLRGAQDYLEALVVKGEFDRVAEANRRFHTTINDAAGSPGALMTVDRHWLILSALLRRYGHGEERFQRVIDDHQHIIRALERRDAGSASMLMGAHIEKAKSNLLRRASQDPQLVNSQIEAGKGAQKRWRMVQ